MPNFFLKFNSKNDRKIKNRRNKQKTASKKILIQLYNYTNVNCINIKLKELYCQIGWKKQTPLYVV